MIHKNPYGVSPTLEITVANTPFDYTSVNLVELLLEENKHDTLILHVSGVPPRAITEYYGRPVLVKFSTGGNFSEEFYGYVEDVRPESFTGFGLMNKSPFQSAKIVCMGTSYVMRGTTSNTWNGYRLSDIAKELASKYSFSLDAPSDNLVHDAILQTNESDWNFITRYSSLLGYSVNVHGTHMHVYDPYKALSRQNSYHKLVTVRQTRGSVTPSPGQVIEFTGTFSKRHIDGEYKASRIAVVGNDNSMYDLSSNQLETAHNGVARYRNRIATYASSYEEADRYIKSRAKKDYDYYATVRVVGLAGCRPGGIVSIDNYNGEFDGFWYVQKVAHTIHSDAFYTEIDIARNFNSELRFTNTEKYRIPPPPVFGKTSWGSSDRVVNEYS